MTETEKALAMYTALKTFFDSPDSLDQLAECLGVCERLAIVGVLENGRCAMIHTHKDNPTTTERDLAGALKDVSEALVGRAKTSFRSRQRPPKA